MKSKTMTILCLKKIQYSSKDIFTRNECKDINESILKKVYWHKSGIQQLFNNIRGLPGGFKFKYAKPLANISYNTWMSDCLFFSPKIQQCNLKLKIFTIIFVLTMIFRFFLLISSFFEQFWPQITGHRWLLITYVLKTSVRKKKTWLFEWADGC